ncbi:hypothetical protein FOA52_005672 [Chlamydomonas sp. UWO 241]|nr:hypothetical protein FOA52_005672 [Chlamydomonas sp. UWO 241]
MTHVDQLPYAWQGLGQGDEPGDLVLRLKEGGGELRVHSQFLKVSSSVFATALSDDFVGVGATGGGQHGCMAHTHTHTQVEGSMAAWRNIMSRLYPMHPRPKLTVQGAYEMLPVAHQYDMTAVMAKLSAFLSKVFPEALSPDPSSQAYVMKWMSLADRLQLEGLREVCMRKPSTPKPIVYETCGGYNHGPACVQWCVNCARWTCIQPVPQTLHATYGCNLCRQ